MRILVVEDEIKLANAIQRALQLQKYAVDCANDGNQGLDLAIGESYDLIILDIMLPGINGIEICRKIRQEKINTPILILTAKDQVADKVLGLDVGADDYMVKPFSFEELFARVRAMMRRHGTIEETVLQAKDLTLNPITFTVKRGGTAVHLSTKEFGLLEYLLKNKNTVVSKEQIIAHVWNYEADVLPNVVEVHLKHLRDKIEAPFSTPIIRTVRGRGYTIEED